MLYLDCSRFLQVLLLFCPTTCTVFFFGLSKNKVKYLIWFFKTIFFGSTYPGDVLNPEEADDDVIVGCPGQKLHCHRPKLLQPRFRPILQTRLRSKSKREREEIAGH